MPQTFTGMQYLKIAIANAYGLDKHVWQDRLNWFKRNQGQLESLDKDADEPVLYRKYVRAFRQAERGEPIGTPIGLDATASGLQMLAVMSGCAKTAEAVNLIDTGKREDVYNKMSDHMSQMLSRPIDRKDLKKPVMTTFTGAPEYLRASLVPNRKLSMPSTRLYSLSFLALTN